MIKIDRTPKPAVLIEKEMHWLNDYMECIDRYHTNPSDQSKKAKNDAERKYNHKEIKAALKEMFSGKCAYCESHILHVDYGDIEHFYPKIKFPNLCFNWENLLLACGICNGKTHKSDLFPDSSEGGPFVNPVIEDPDEFFEFEFDPDTGTANVIAKNQRGITTETKLGLNRPDLVKHRSSVVRKMALLAVKASKGEHEFFDMLLKCCDKDDEYAAFARALVKRFNLL